MSDKPCDTRDIITREELGTALRDLNFWWRDSWNSAIAWRGCILHPEDAADDILLAVKKRRA